MKILSKVFLFIMALIGVGFVTGFIGTHNNLGTLGITIVACVLTNMVIGSIKIINEDV